MSFYYDGFSFDFLDTQKTKLILKQIIQIFPTTERIIPSTVNGYPVCAIDNQVFSLTNQPNLKKVCIPDSVIKIGSEAFKNCENLESIVFIKQMLKLQFWKSEKNHSLVVESYGNLCVPFILLLVIMPLKIAGHCNILKQFLFMWENTVFTTVKIFLH